VIIINRVVFSKVALAVNFIFMEFLATCEFRVDFLWASFVLCVVLTEIVPQLKGIANHGKFNDPDNSSSVFNTIHSHLQVPKCWFLHMYILSVTLSVCVLYTLIANSQSTNTHVLWCLCLWTLHGIRRLLESLFITTYGKSKMHIGGYMAGIVHYCEYRNISHYFVLFSCIFPIGAVPVTILQDTAANACLAPPLSSVLSVCAVLLFAASSYWQWDAHFVLYHMKQAQLQSNSKMTSKTPHYALPNQSLFAHVCCPHYTAEMALYLSFCLLLPCRPAMWLMLLWVTANLSVVANRQYQWYAEKHRDEISPGWCRLLPGIW
jgi:hypothetical protein